MKCALAVHGSRGDVEPHAAVARELLRRGHEVRIAVPPDLRGLMESAGLAAVAYGPDTREVLFGTAWGKKNPIKLSAWRNYLGLVWREMATTLTALADGADLLVTGNVHQGLAANVAEHYDIPLATLHSMPIRVNGRLLPGLPAPLTRCAISGFWWLHWLLTKEAEDAQRRDLGLPQTSAPSTQRIARRGSLEIQAYEEFFFPGLAEEWAQWNDRRPFVGALTMELPTAADDEVLSWIAAGTPPIYFGFGSTPLRSPADTVAMIATACAQLGERALIYSGAHDRRLIPHAEHVKAVGALNYGAILPACRAVVHHGGAGTTAAGLRAGIPTLILWIRNEQPIWGEVVKRLNVGSCQRLSRTTRESLVAGLSFILRPECVRRARDLATRMTKPAVSVTAAADLLESTAGARRFG
ncbi:glycosyltransferase [Mycobacterium sp. SM1]|uniref:glycosyltransferase n=1 Tax=Mycobacterium sp. SM1 TaxID=2816243 RepID=UPI001BD0100D|nr:glycosyltransferase [Mycobacterium sp. SM1]MBS4726891.1 glycosyltransferase [Mycobacterium sp. SM1]